jgi:cellulose biosynthesis protein BcsQ
MPEEWDKVKIRDIVNDSVFKSIYDVTVNELLNEPSILVKWHKGWLEERKTHPKYKPGTGGHLFPTLTSLRTGLKRFGLTVDDLTTYGINAPTILKNVELAESKEVTPASLPVVEVPKSTRNCQVVAICNFKGGVGKTTCALSFAHYLKVVRKERVLLIDFDDQSDKRMVKTAVTKTILDVFQDVGHANKFRHLYIDKTGETHKIHGSSEIAIAYSKHAWDGRFTAFIKKISSDYDWIVIDCSPSNVMSRPIFKACTWVVIPSTYDSADNIVTMQSVQLFVEDLQQNDDDVVQIACSVMVQPSKPATLAEKKAQEEKLKLKGIPSCKNEFKRLPGRVNNLKSEGKSVFSSGYRGDAAGVAAKVFAEVLGHMGITD